MYNHLPSHEVVRNFIVHVQYYNGLPSITHQTIVFQPGAFRTMDLIPKGEIESAEWVHPKPNPKPNPKPEPNSNPEPELAIMENFMPDYTFPHELEYLELEPYRYLQRTLSETQEIEM